MSRETTQKLGEFFRAEHQNLRAFVRSRIASLEESDDLLQDVYVQLLGNLNVLDSIDNLTGWVYTVVRNRVIDWYRKRKPDTISLDEPIDEGIRFEDVLTEEIPADLDPVEREAILESIMASIDQLPENQKYIFIEQVINGRTFKELSIETGEPLNTLIARKRYAVLFLRERLKSFTKQEV